MFILFCTHCSISELKNLETLIMSWNNFSRGLPDAFASMTSLTTLGASDCQLTTLPER